MHSEHKSTILPVTQSVFKSRHIVATGCHTTDAGDHAFAGQFETSACHQQTLCHVYRQTARKLSKIFAKAAVSGVIDLTVHH